MSYWWVNQNKTFRQEVGGGYLWSPKLKKNQTRNPFYDSMRQVAPGDVIFSFADTYIRAIGVAGSHAYEAPKPLEFGQAGAHWDMIGWRVDIGFSQLRMPMKPADQMAALTPLLPDRYSPLRPNGAGLQNMYLTRIPEVFAAGLIDLLGAEAHALVRGYRVAESLPLSPAIGLIQWEERELNVITADETIPETDRLAIVLARRGQGLFKQRVMRLEKACRVTGVTREEHLRASHCKPWRDSNNNERLDAENGLLLTPSVDHLFDRGFIGFEDDGDLIVSPVADRESLQRMGIDTRNRINVGVFSSGQRNYLNFHRDSVLLRSRFLDEG